jgi:uncharacterized protein
MFEILARAGSSATRFHLSRIATSTPLFVGSCVAEPANRSPNPRPAADVSANLLLGRVMEFCRLLKRAGFNVTPARIIDAFRSLQYVQLRRREDFAIALRANLTSNHEEEEVFDRLFAEFWRSERRENEQPRKLESKSIIQDTDYEYREKPTGSPLQYGREEVLRTKDLCAEWPGESAGMKAVVRELVRRLATRPSRRFIAGHTGRRIDLRRSLRHNINYGVDILELSRVRRKIRETRVALLCDVSGSMDTYNPLLRLMFGLQKACKNSRTAAFRARTTEITKALRRHTVPARRGCPSCAGLVWGDGSGRSACSSESGCASRRSCPFNSRCDHQRWL